MKKGGENTSNNKIQLSHEGEVKSVKVYIHRSSPTQRGNFSFSYLPNQMDKKKLL